MNLSENLKKIRKDNNLSQEDLAEKLGVSRQSVSKWESGAAYPEMDKVIQLCNMFNLNIDELLNQNIKEVENNKKSSFNVNKYIDEFFGYVTKTVNMFSSMKFKDKFKCLFEQCFLILVFFILANIIGSILGDIVGGLINFLPYKAFNVFFQIFKSIFYLVAVGVGIILLLHIFKTRYLDYYVIVDNEEKKESQEDKDDTKEEKTEKKELIRKEEKVIIRDPKHSSFKFVDGIFKVVLFLIKMFVLFIGMWFCFSLVGFVSALVISFIIAKSGILFVGILLGLIGLITINIIVLKLIYSFVFNKKCNPLRIFILFIASLILGGVAIAFVFFGCRDFKYFEEYDGPLVVKTEEEINMTKDLYINYPVEFIESNNKNLKIVYESTPVFTHSAKIDNNELYFLNNYNSEKNIVDFYIECINNKVLVDPDSTKIYIYTTKENIKTLENNNIKARNNHYNKIIEEQDKKINELENKLNDCYINNQECQQ